MNYLQCKKFKIYFRKLGNYKLIIKNLKKIINCVIENLRKLK